MRTYNSNVPLLLHFARSQRLLTTPNDIHADFSNSIFNMSDTFLTFYYAHEAYVVASTPYYLRLLGHSIPNINWTQTRMEALFELGWELTPFIA